MNTLAFLAMLEPVVQLVVAAFAAMSLSVVLWQLWRFSARHRHVEALCAIDLGWEPSSTPELHKYLHSARDRVDVGSDRRFLLSMSRGEMLKELAAGARPLRLGGVFTGIALFLTFVLIGYVLVTDMRGALQSFSKAGVGAPGQGALDEASRRLAAGVGGLGAKFFISATGIFFTVVYAVSEVWLDERHHRKLANLERRLRSVFASPSEYDGLLQRRQADVLSEIGTKLERLGSIEVTIQNLSNDAVHHLSQVMTKDLGERVESIMSQALDRVEVIAGRAKQGLSDDLQKAMAVAQQAIPRIVAHLDAIRSEVAQQARSPVEELLKQFSSALSGGYQQETAQLGVALRQLSAAVPEMARSLEAAGRQVTDTVAEEQKRAQGMQQKLFSDMREMFAQLERQQSAMGDLVKQIQGETVATAANLGSKLKEQVDAAASGFARVASTQTDAMSRRFDSVLSTQQAVFTELESRVSLIAEALGQADKALASSARQLQSSAQHLEVAGATADKNLAAAASVVNAVRNSAEVLNHTAVSTQAFLDQAKRVVHESMERAHKEAELTKQLQAVWPGLLDQYLKSFQQKSEALSSSWEKTHKQVVDVTAGVVDQLQQPVDELCDAVKRLAETQKANHAR